MITTIHLNMLSKGLSIVVSINGDSFIFGVLHTPTRLVEESNKTCIQTYYKSVEIIVFGLSTGTTRGHA